MLHSLDRRSPVTEESFGKHGGWRNAEGGPSLLGGIRLASSGSGSAAVFRRVLSHALIDISEDVEISTPQQVCLEPSSPDLLYQVGSSSSINRRTKMEDRMVISDLTTEKAFAGTKRALLMAVFDGHGGHEAAEYLASTLRSGLLDSPALSRRDYGAALRDVLLEAERTFMQEYFTSGTTALVVLMVDHLLYIANVGDCRAVVCDDSEARALTWDHKPSNQLEKARLEAGGAKLSSDGYVEVDGTRVDGIALSRALGGAQIKQAAAVAAAQHSTSPSCTSPAACAHAPQHKQQHEAPGAAAGCSPCRPPCPERDTPFLRYDRDQLGDADQLHASLLGPPSPSFRPPSTSTSDLLGFGSGASLCSSQVASRQQSGMMSESSAVIAEPELFQYTIHQGSEFLILGSDGLWDAVRNSEAVTRVHRWLGEDQSVDEAAAALVNYAVRMGSHDNVSVMLLRFSSRPLLLPATPRHANSALRKSRSVAVMAEQQTSTPALHRVESSL